MAVPSLILPRDVYPYETVGKAAIVVVAAVRRTEVVHPGSHDVVTRRGERNDHAGGAVPLRKCDNLGSGRLTSSSKSCHSSGTSSSSGSSNSSRIRLLRLRERVGLVPRVHHRSRALELGPHHSKGNLRCTGIVRIPLGGVRGADREREGRSYRHCLRTFCRDAWRSPAHAGLRVEGDAGR